MNQALDGIKVIDVSQVAAVPMAARHLADFGAEVIHVENPKTGDSWRGFQAGLGSGGAGAPSKINYNWETYNRNKRSLAVDLSQDEGRDIIYRLVEGADVFTTNLRLFEREKFKLDYDALGQLNPRLIYAGLSGYGKNGPDRNDPAYDSIAYWARSGLGYLLGVPGSAPLIDGGGIGDNVTALSLFAGIMTSLYVREKTGMGQEVDLSLLNVGLYQLSFFIAGALTTGLDLADWRVKSREEALNPLTLPYEAKDGRWVLLALLQQERYWSQFCKAIDREDLEHDPRFEVFEVRMENCAALYHIVEDVFRERPLAEWQSRLKIAGLPFAPYQTFVEAIADPQARANDMFVTIDHPTHGNLEVIANPIKLSKTPATLRMPAPEFSQHTEEVLLENGYTWEDIDRLKSKGVIA
ncbi:MAG: CoA transferase [Dehalococcoidales bacterium]|nr:CoA transferase [Dehalococcoidales bacterium]